MLNRMNGFRHKQQRCMEKIIINRIRCCKCGEIITSHHVHDFKMCGCGTCGVDGGQEYLRRIGDREDWEELSEVDTK